MLTDTASFWQLYPSSKCLEKCNVLEAGFVSVFRKEAPNLVDPLDEAIFSHWAPQKQ